MHFKFSENPRSNGGLSLNNTVCPAKIDDPLRPQYRFPSNVISNCLCICGLAPDLHMRLVGKQHSLVCRRCLISRSRLMTYCPKSAKLCRPIQLKRVRRAQSWKKDKEPQKRGRQKMNRRRTNSLHSVPSESTTRRMIHGKKIANIRRQLARGQYGIDERINIVLDRILEDLIRGKNEQ